MNEPDNNLNSYRPNFLKDWFRLLDTRKRRLIESGRFRIFLLLTLLLFLSLLATASSFSLLSADFIALFSPLVPWLSLASLTLISILAFMVWRELLDPLLRLSRWADLMRGVHLDARVDLAPDCDFSELADDVNMLSRMIFQLSRETELQLEKHTSYLSRESRSLTILYEVASSINLSRDIDELFHKSLDSLCQNLPVQGGLIRKLMDNDKLELVAMKGNLNQAFVDRVNQLLPFRSRRKANFGKSENLSSRTVLEATKGSQQDELLVVSVPLLYRDKPSGVINLFFPESKHSELDYYNELLLSIGQHLGTAVEKYRMDEDESQLLVMQERTRLSHELHDSLAQTMASLKIQVRILDEIFHAGDEAGIQNQVERVEYIIEEANKQLRELIAHFRIPMNQQGLVTAIQESIDNLRSETDIQVYLQNEWTSQELPSNIELEVLRILQEGLVNIRKHSQARSVRILLRALRVGGKHLVLIEDDGIGFDESDIRSEGGEHLGLSILRDRAAQINGSISIDSEPGDGTRVTLEFVYPQTLNEQA